MAITTTFSCHCKSYEAGTFKMDRVNFLTEKADFTTDTAKKVLIFLSSAGTSLTKLFLAGYN
jgi:hypothetical protein